MCAPPTLGGAHLCAGSHHLACGHLARPMRQPKLLYIFRVAGGAVHRQSKTAVAKSLLVPKSQGTGNWALGSSIKYLDQWNFVRPYQTQSGLTFATPPGRTSLHGLYSHSDRCAGWSATGLTQTHSENRRLHNLLVHILCKYIGHVLCAKDFI